MMALYELKPCPFCGGAADVFRVGDDLWRVECNDCDATSAEKRLAETAVRLWNTRVEPTP